MKICFVIEKYPNHPNCSGGEFSAQKLLIALAKKGLDVNVVTVRYDGSLEKQEENGVKIHRLLSSDYGFGAKGSGIKYLYMQHEGIYKHVEKKLLGFLAENEMDVLHCHSPNMIAPVCRVAKKMKFLCSMMVNEQFMTCAAGKKHIRDGILCNDCSFIKTFFCNQIGKNSINKKALAIYFYFRMLMYKHYARRYDVVFCASRDVKERLDTIGIHNTAVIFNIAEGLSSKEVVVNKSQLDIRQIKNNFARLILFIATDLKDTTKGLPVVLEVANRLKQYAFICIGRYNKDTANNLKNLFFTGQISQEQLRGSYLIADLVVIPSICPDALPRVGLEALALGKPLIGSNCGGISDLIENGVNGYLFTPGDVNDFKNKITEIFLDSHKLILMSENSLRKAKTIFSPEIVADRVITYYENLISKNRRKQ